MFVVNDKIKKLLGLTDLVLLDIKHIDPKKCEQLVGFSNELELNFAKYLSDNGIPLWIRQVLIPGITDNKKDLIKLREFVGSLKTVQKFELLPYHDMGKFKWKQLGLDYPLSDIKTATEKDIKKAELYLK